MTSQEKTLESLLKERDYLVADYCDGNPHHKRLTNFLYDVRYALTELEEIKKRAEEVCANPPYGYFTENQMANIIGGIIKGELK